MPHCCLEYRMCECCTAETCMNICCQRVQMFCTGVYRQRRGSKGPLSPKGSGLPPLSPKGSGLLPLSPKGSGLPPLSPEGAGLPPCSEADGMQPSLEAGNVVIGLESRPSGGTGGTVLKKDSFKEAKFYDAKSTNLPVYGKRVGDADIIEGPMEAEPQVRCCAVLCCAVLCCAKLCCAVLCCAARFLAVLPLLSPFCPGFSVVQMTLAHSSLCLSVKITLTTTHMRQSAAWMQSCFEPTLTLTVTVTPMTTVKVITNINFNCF